MITNTIESNALSQRLRIAISSFIDSGAIAGVVTAVADGQEILGAAALGAADIAEGKPMRMDSVFWIASQTKTMTAAAVMMLVDEGKVMLDDPVEKYLPELSDLWVVEEKSDERMVFSRPKRAITIRHILSHSSGMHFATGIEYPTLDRFPLATGVRSYAMVPLMWQPGTQYAYSNAGINTAGRVIEVVSGIPYESFMQERLFAPIGMRDTTFWPDAEQISRIAETYTPNADKTSLLPIPINQLQYPLDGPGRYPMPAGGLFSTLTDCIAFCQMLLNGGTYGGRTYLSAESVRQMSMRQTAPEASTSYGLGCDIGSDYFGHGGANSTGMSIYPARGRITVFLVQHQGFLGDGDQCQSAMKAAALEAS